MKILYEKLLKAIVIVGTPFSGRTSIAKIIATNENLFLLPSNNILYSTILKYAYLFDLGDRINKIEKNRLIVFQNERKEAWEKISIQLANDIGLSWINSLSPIIVIGNERDDEEIADMFE